MANIDKWLWALAKKKYMQWLQLGGRETTIGSETFLVFLYDNSGNILLAAGTDKPADAGAGFAKGALFCDTNVGAGSSGLYENVGTTASCNFDAVASAADTALDDGKIMIGGADNVQHPFAVTGDITMTNGGVTTIGAKKVTAAKIALAEGKVFIGAAGGAAAEQTLSGDITVTAAGVTAVGAKKIKLAMLNTDIGFRVVLANTHTTTGGGAAEDIEAVGALDTDIAIVTIQDNGTNNVTLLQSKVKAGGDALACTFSGDPGGDTIVNYIVLRAIPA